MTTPIQPDQYETWETIILTGQLDQLGAGKLFEANPEFADWYRKRAAARKAATRSDF